MVGCNGNLSWKDVSGDSPCPRCGKPDWCRVDERGDWCCCRRVADGGEEKTDGSGGTYWVHRLTPWPERQAAPPPPRFAAADGVDRKADAETLDLVYQTLLHATGRLDVGHQVALQQRGHDPREARKRGYASLGKKRIDVVTALIQEGLEEHFPRVPGFYVRDRPGKPRCWSLTAPGGILIPVRNANGLVVALLVRVDAPTDGRKKYVWLSSKKHGGPGPGAPTHFPLFDGDKATVRVTEGALKADLATIQSGVFTVGLSSTSNWKNATRAMREVGARTVKVAFDADCRTNRQVARYLQRLVVGLHDEGFAVELETWKVEDGKGIDDLFAARKQPDVVAGAEAVRAAVARILAEADAADPPPGNVTAAVAADDRPVIGITTEEHEVNDQVIVALAREPNLYERGGYLARVLRGESRSRHVRRVENAPRIAILEEPTLREMMTRVARWVRVNDEGEEESAHPPTWSVKAVHRRGEWPGIRHLSGVVEAPALREDGTILDEPGYDHATGLLYEPSADYPPVPTAPTREDARQAAGVLLELVAEFPFVDDSHRAVWLAGLLTVFARQAISGPCPLFLFEASAAGSGKTLLAEIVGIIATGREPSVSELSNDNEEVRKAITSILIEGERIVLLDNAHAYLGSAALDAVLTATTWKGRILGKSERTADLPANTIWLASGNNVQLRGDTHRRVLPCRLEPSVERPEEREGFRIPDLKAHVRDNRPRLVIAALAVLRGYFAAGCPRAALPAFGSYEAWSNVVRQATHWATGLDPCAARKAITAESRGNADNVADVFAGWSELPGGTQGGLTAKCALTILKDGRNAQRYGTLREAIAPWAKGTPLPDSGILGNRLARLRGRVVGKWQLRSTPDAHTKAHRWWVQLVGGGAEAAGAAEATSDPSRAGTGAGDPERGEAASAAPAASATQADPDAWDVFDDDGAIPDLSGPWDGEG